MENNTKIIDLTVGQLLALISEHKAKKQKKRFSKPVIDFTQCINYEKETILKFLTTDLSYGPIERMTCTQIKEYIESVSPNDKFANLKSLGIQLISVFGRSKQIRGIGFCYNVIKKPII